MISTISVAMAFYNTLAFSFGGLSDVFFAFGWFCIYAAVSIGLHTWVDASLVSSPLNKEGERLSYRINGFKCFTRKFAIMYVLWMFNLFSSFSPMGFLIVSLSFSIFLSLFVAMKSESTTVSEFLQSFYTGVAVAPRIGALDLKLFLVSHIGMSAWGLLCCSTLVNGIETGKSGVILPSILQLVYVVDFFVYEDWYCNTLDITYDNLGFYMIWGMLGWVPSFYTLPLQVGYLEKLSGTGIEIISVILLFILMYLGFRISNTQRFYFRRWLDARILQKCSNELRDRYEESYISRPSREVDYINDKIVVYIKVYYNIGYSRHTSGLLCSGLWSFSRHVNYIFDMGIALCFGLATFSFTWKAFAYFLFLSGILTHRSMRDELKCSKKYGEGWEMYKKEVPYCLIKYIY